MAEQEQEQETELTAAGIRKLLKEKFPPKANPDGSPVVDREYVLCAVVLAMAENVETLENAVVVLAGNLEAMEKRAVSLSKVIGSVAKLAGVDLTAALAAAGVAGAAASATAPSAEPSVSNDKTPFPDGLSASAPPGTAPKVTVVDVPAPDVQGTPAINTQPIPASPNGAKVQQ